MSTHPDASTTQDALKIMGPRGWDEKGVGELGWLFLSWFKTGLDEPSKEARDWQGNHAFATCNSFELKSDFEVQKSQSPALPVTPWVEVLKTPLNFTQMRRIRNHFILGSRPIMLFLKDSVHFADRYL